MQRQRKGSPIQNNNDFPRTSSWKSRTFYKHDNRFDKPSRSGSPPPHLEPQLDKSISRSDSASPDEKDEGPEELIPEDDVDQRISGFVQLAESKVQLDFQFSGPRSKSNPED